MKELETLLKKVRQITDKYDEIAYLKGENFNLFKILDRRYDEVKSHSAMLAELLNPKGSHGIGNVFLNLFIEMINKKFNLTNNENFKGITSGTFEDTKIFVEYPIGEINYEEATGGRIDILLQNNDFKICIENKIYADDQDLQLRRYYNYLHATNSGNTCLLYLTLNGEKASIKSIAKRIIKKDGNDNEKSFDETDLLVEDKNYYCISYRQDVLQWLQSCYKASVEFPILRESLKQYIILIKSLTNQLTSDKMAEEVHKAIINDIKSAENIAKEFEKAINNVAIELREFVLEKLKKQYQKVYKEDIRSNISLFIPVANGLLGIESFNSFGNFNEKSLFIGLLIKNNERDNWKWTNEEIIFSKDTLMVKLQDYTDKTKREEIVNYIVKTINNYIERYNLTMTF